MTHWCRPTFSKCIKYSLQNQFQCTIGRAGKFVDDDDSALTEQRDCLERSRSRWQEEEQTEAKTVFAILFMFLNFLTVEKFPKTNNLLGEGVRNYHYYE